jgi:hypothetical protein
MLKDIQAAASVSGPGPKVGGAKLSGGGERLIDPATMLIYRETSTRTIKMPMNVPGRGIVTVRAQETRGYSYDYGGSDNP